MIAGLLVPATAVGANAPRGQIAQLQGTSGCVADRSEDRGKCASARALRGPGPFLGSEAIAISPDGKNVYVAASSSDAIAVFRRKGKSGTLSQGSGAAGCIASGGGDGCAAATGLDGPNSVAVSPDGENVYATSVDSDTVTAFSRDQSDGSLTQIGGGAGCIANAATSGCTTGRALDGADVVVVSPDGENVYVGSFFGNAVAAFARGANGGLTQLSGDAGCLGDQAGTGCASGRALIAPEGLAISDDGRNVYAAAAGTSALLTFLRDPSTGALTQAPGEAGCIADGGLPGCTAGRQLSGANAVAVSPDDENVYVTSLFSNSVTSFARTPSTGTLAQLDGTAGCLIYLVAVGCSLGQAMEAPEGLTLSADGASLYATAFESGAIDVIDRRGSGALVQKPLRRGCLAGKSTRNCTPARALLGASSAAVSADGRYLYTTAFASNAVGVFKRSTGNTSGDRRQMRKAGKSRIVLLGLRRDGKALSQFANMASNPTGDAYGQFLELDDLKERFGAPEKPRTRVMRFLRRSKGVRSVELSSTGGVVMATSSQAAAEDLFCAHGMRPPQKGVCVPRPIRNAVRQITVGEIFGGSSRRDARPVRQASGTPQGCQDGVSSGSFTPNQLATAYGTDVLNARGLNGDGQRVVILSSAMVDASAFTTWAQCFGLPTPNFEQVAMPSATIDTSTEPDETYLDVQALAVAAPRLDRTTAIFVPLDQAFMHSFDLFMLGALDPARQGGNLPDVLSLSDSVCESQFNRDQRRIAQHFLGAAAALGITVAAASGDLGFLGCQENAKGPGYPASSRFVTGVGGTDLTLDAQNRIAQQSVWSTFPQETNGSGGGQSTVFNRPGWQTGPGVDAAIQSGDSTRLSPDLASMASFTPGIAVFSGGEGWTGGGGTSAATPLTAGLVALVREQEAAAGRPPLGSINPLLYQFARGPAYGSIFSDVVTGTSSPTPTTPLGQSPAGGAAQPGYDLATGLGSLNGPAFADAVAAARTGR